MLGRAIQNRREAIRVPSAFRSESTRFGNAGIFEREGTMEMGVLRARSAQRRFWITL